MQLACIGIFQNKMREVLIIPRWRDENGINRDSQKFVKLNTNFTEYDLGMQIITMIEISKNNEQEIYKTKTYEKATGLKSWNAFQKKYEQVVVEVSDKQEWSFARLLKKNGHSYGLDTDDNSDKYTRIFPAPLPPEELGKVVLELFAMK